ncbi:protein kinase [Actinomadura rubrisoli]|uniref:Protein kinase domain-containing protein n=1 Tax=Actinomadura rubrisoli TaxID=2530368 RepID=A0A4R5B3S5_9ACTN|nr:protein kinase [Actinomadura rubrisoli]TDD79865.1 hypothetical protein E1298_26965 [Actinomadura rubrisoli]
MTRDRWFSRLRRGSRDEAGPETQEARPGAVEAGPEADGPGPENEMTRPEAEPGAWRPGAVLAQVLEVGDQIGADATGVWHRVVHAGWRQEFSVKSPPADAAGLLDEARVWLEVPPHPHLLGCCFVREVAGRPRIFAEHAPGGGLGEAELEGRSALDVAIQLAWGLTALHEAGLVHGDVRADNVVLAGDGTAKLTGFGPAQGDDADDVRSWAATVAEMCERAGAGHLVPSILGLVTQHPDMAAITESLTAMYEREFGGSYPRQAPVPVALTADEWNNKALSLLALGEEERAEACWERALQDDPRHPDATFNAGVRAWRAARMADDEVVRRMEAVRQANAGIDDAAARGAYLLALLHLERGDPTSAREALAEAARLAPGDPEIAGVRTGEVNDLRLAPDPPAGWLSAAAVTPDGRHALSGSADGVLRWWDLTTGECVRALTGHTEQVRSVAVTPDGRHALSGAEDGTIRWWDLRKGRCLHTLTGHKDAVLSVALTPDGRYAMSGGGGDGTVRLWDLRDGRCLAVADHKETVYSVAVTPDRGLALSAGGDGALQLWDLRGGKRLGVLNAHDDLVYAAAMTPDGRRALSVGKDKKVRWWDLTTGECLRELKGHTDASCGAAVTPEGRYAATFGFDRTARWWDLETGRCLRTLEHDILGLVVAMTPDGRRVVSGTTGGVLRLWNIAENVRAPWSHSRPVGAVGLAERAREVGARMDEARKLLADRDNAAAVDVMNRARAVPGHARRPDVLHLWRTAGSLGERGAFLDFRPIRTMAAPSGLTSVAVSARAGHAVSGGWDDALRWWDLDTGECLRVLEGHEDAVTSVSIAAAGDRAVSGGDDDALRWWDLATGECLRVLSGHGGSVTSVALTRDGDRALSGSFDGTLRWWDLATGECLLELTDHEDAVTSVAINPDGCHAVSGSWDRTSRFWDLKTGECKETFRSQPSQIQAVSMTPSCRYSFSGDDGGAVTWWAGERTLGELYGHVGAVTSLAVTSDASHALSASRDGTLRWWELESGRCRRILTHDADEICSVALTPGARHALSGGSDGAIVLWAVDWDFTFEEER